MTNHNPLQLDLFTSLDDVIKIDGIELTAATAQDTNHAAPWRENDGHGPVSDWTKRNKRAGELVLIRDNNASSNWARYYDFSEACRIARSDHWGPSPYSMRIEQGANGLVKANATWFEGRAMICEASIWHDCENAARAECYNNLKAQIGPRRYAAMAARADFERLKAWCNDEWHYSGVIVTARKNRIELASASLWGIESDADADLIETANNLREDVLEAARAAIASLCDKGA